MFIRYYLMIALLFAIFCTFVAQTAKAENWVRASDAEAGSKAGFELKSSCEAGGHACLKADGLDLDALKVVDAQVDDLSKPLYGAASNVQACFPEESCQALIAQPGFCEAPDQPFYRVAGGGYEAYCSALLGYEKKTEKQLAEDPAKLQAKADAAAAAQARQAKLNALKGLRKACLATLSNGSATTAQIRTCSLVNTKLGAQEELTTDEL